MNQSFWLWLLIGLFAENICAQDKDLINNYDSFRKKAKQDYDTFRNQANREYADFVEHAWKQYHALQAVPQPHEEKIQPIIYEEKDNGNNQHIKHLKEREYEKDDFRNENKKKIAVKHDQKIKPNSTIQNENKVLNDENKQLVIDEIILTPTPEPQPKPISPINEQDDDGTSLSFLFFQTSVKIRVSSHPFRLESLTEKAIATAWRQLASSNWDNTIRDCLENRFRYNLCDWGYLLMLDQLSHELYKTSSNEATLMTAYLYCQSGYKMRLASANGKLVMLYASKHQIYNIPYFSINGDLYYPFKATPQSLNVCEASFPSETPLSLLVDKEQKLGGTMSEERRLRAERYPDLQIIIRENIDLMPFYETYPTSKLGENNVSRWAIYASTPICEKTRNQLYPVLEQYINGKSILEKASVLLNWVQTSFEYKLDDKVWGHDRAFFADETLYYPYCDCEDRSILFSRLIRDILGLDVALVYYPGHLATAIRFTDEIQGDFLLINGKRYTIADPTYIGAPIGATMPDMDNHSAKVIIVQ